MQTSKYYWQSLLELWMRKHKRHALTIPFVLGAKNVLDSNYIPKITDVDVLFDEIIASDEDIIIEVSVCASLKVFVLSILRDPLVLPDIVATHPLSGNVKLAFATETIPLYTPIELIQRIKSETKEAIESRNFSRNFGQWTPYLDDEVLFIKEAIS
jgi:hypothetical protein